MPAKAGHSVAGREGAGLICLPVWTKRERSGGESLAPKPRCSVWWAELALESGAWGKMTADIRVQAGWRYRGP